MKNPKIKFRSGPPTVLSENEENMLVKWIIEYGNPKKISKTQKRFTKRVKKFLEENERPNRFKNNLSGKHII